MPGKWKIFNDQWSRSYNALFTRCIPKTDETIVMSMYNLLEYSSNTTSSLWLYSKDELNNFKNDIAKTDKFKSFKFKAKLLWNTVSQSAPNQGNGIRKKFNNDRAIKIFKKLLEITCNAIY